MKTNDKYRGDLQVGNVSYKDDMLYKIDEIRKRTNATYEAAKLALEKASGDVVQALVELEKSSARRGSSKSKGPTWCAQCQRSYAGNASRIIVRSGDYVVADIPVTIGVVAAVLAPWLAVLSSVALLLSTWTVEIERPIDENGQ